MKKQICNMGLAIEHFKAEANITAYKICQITSIDEGTLTKLKYGRTSPSIDTIERVAKVLNVRASDIQLFKEALDDVENAER